MSSNHTHPPQALPDVSTSHSKGNPLAPLDHIMTMAILAYGGIAKLLLAIDSACPPYPRYALTKGGGWSYSGTMQSQEMRDILPAWLSFVPDNGRFRMYVQVLQVLYRLIRNSDGAFQPGADVYPAYRLAVHDVAKWLAYQRVPDAVPYTVYPGASFCFSLLVGETTPCPWGERCNGTCESGAPAPPPPPPLESNSGSDTESVTYSDSDETESETY